MTWTTDYPNQHLRETPDVVQLYSFRHQDQELDVVFGGRTRPLKRNEFISAEWYGPIEPPE